MGPASARTHSCVNTDATSVHADGFYFLFFIFFYVLVDGTCVHTNGARVQAGGHGGCANRAHVLTDALGYVRT
jgi:hypothetical protein